MSKITLSEADEIKGRKVGDQVPGLMTIDPSLGEYKFGDLTQYVEFAKVMCQAGVMLPKHAQNNPSICLALTMRAVHWGFDPFALALETYQANDGAPVAYQAKVFTAVLRKAGVILQYRYEGDLTITDKPALSAKGNVVAKRAAVGNRRCIAFAEEGGVMMEYSTPELDQITIKNSGLWHNDPDQQLAYYAGRGWARRYRADLMMGAYSDDEVAEMRPRDITPRESGFVRLGMDARNKPTTASPSTSDKQPPKAVDDDAEKAREEADKSKPAWTEDSPAYQMGVEAAKEGNYGRDDGPFKSKPEAAVEHEAWLAGFDSVEAESDD